MSEPKFSDMWRQLQVPTSGEFMMGDVARTRTGRPIKLALDSEGFHHLLVPADEFADIADRGSGALKVRTKTIGTSGHDYQVFLDIYCVDSSLTATFDRLATELIEVAQFGKSPYDDALEALGHWRSLFSTARRQSLSPQQRIGLFAELSVLKEFAEEQAIIETSCWTGPSRAPHDFEFDYMSLEVKAYGAGTEHVTFHGPLQMDNVDGKPLYLCLREIEEDPDGQTLLELAAEIEDLVEDHAKFRLTINKIGIHDDDATLQSARYRTVKETLMQVTDSTPRIVASSFIDGVVPEGIERLRYSILPEDLITEAASGDFKTWLEEVRR